jgi:hypothetical protein
MRKIKEDIVVFEKYIIDSLKKLESLSLKK